MRYRWPIGITNFNAECVSENLATLMSTRPAAFPAAITSPSEIASLPRGRITQMAPSRVIVFFQRRELLQRGAIVRLQEDQLGLAARARRDVRARLLKLRAERRISHADNQHTLRALDAELLDAAPVRVGELGPPRFRHSADSVIVSITSVESSDAGCRHAMIGA